MKTFCRPLGQVGKKADALRDRKVPLKRKKENLKTESNSTVSKNSLSGFKGSIDKNTLA